MRWRNWLAEHRPWNRRATDGVPGSGSAISFPLRQAVPPQLAGIRGITCQDAVEALVGAGFWVLRSGVHVVMTDGRRILTIPCQDPVNALTMEGLVRDSGLSVEQFRDLL